MWEYLIDAFQKAGLVAAWGAVVATGLAGIKIWETFIRDRTRLETTFSWTTEDGEPDTISVINIGPHPLIVGYWQLKWEAGLLSKHKEDIDETPAPYDYEQKPFKIEPHGTWTLSLDDEIKFPWTRRQSGGLKLYLYLHVFGRRRPIRLRIV